MEKIPVLKANQVGYGGLFEYDSGVIRPEHNMHQLNESQSKGEDANIVYAVLQKYGVLNRNGRIYPKEVLEREFEAYKKLIQIHASAGELDHPETAIIQAEKTSHYILDIWWEGVTIMGKLKLDTSPAYLRDGQVFTLGDSVLNKMRNGMQLGVSSRGVGSVKQMDKNTKVVQNDFEIICWDIVTTPSTNGSWMFNNLADTKPYVEGISGKQEENIIKVATNDSKFDSIANFLKKW